MTEMKKLPIGIEFFREFKSDNFYYVDKTGFIEKRHICGHLKPIPL